MRGNIPSEWEETDEKMAIKAKELSLCVDVMPQNITEVQDKVYNALLDFIYMYHDEITRERDEYYRFGIEECLEKGETLKDKCQETCLYEQDKPEDITNGCDCGTVSWNSAISDYQEQIKKLIP